MMGLTSSPRLRTASGWAASLAIHAGVAAALLTGMSQAGPHRGDETIRLAIREAPRPAPRRVPPVEVKPVAAPALVERPAPPAIPAAAAPAPNASLPQEPSRQVPRRVFGVSAHSVTAASGGGGMAVPVGNTLMTAPDKELTPPDEVRPYTGPAPAGAVVPAWRLTTMPVPKKTVKAPYPEDARRAGIEGAVLLELTIDEQGHVTAVRLVEGVGHGLDEPAIAAAGQFLFEPARVDGVPVATVITFTYRWELLD
jgi:periplasmic protein TonB